MLLDKKLKLFGSRVVHFWTGIWLSLNDGLSADTEVWDNGNTSNGDGSQTPESDEDTSNNLYILFYFRTKI